MTHYLAGLALSAALALAADPKAQPHMDDPRTLTVGDNTVAPIYVCELQEPILVLPANEQAMRAFVADTKNWVVSSGRGDAQPTRYLGIKTRNPQRPETILTVVSNHDHQYTFRLIANADHCDTKVEIEGDTQVQQEVAKADPWLSPADAKRLQQQLDEEKAKVSEAAKKADADEAAFTASYPQQLRFDYTFDRKQAERMGIQAIWHDRKFTYISAHGEEPPTLLEVKEGKPSVIRFEYGGGVYWTGRVLADGYLTVGGDAKGKHAERLEFHREPGGDE